MNGADKRVSVCYSRIYKVSSHEFFLNSVPSYHITPDLSALFWIEYKNIPLKFNESW